MIVALLHPRPNRCMSVAALIGWCRNCCGCGDVGERTVGNPFGGGLDRVPCKVGIASGSLGLTVAEKLTGHRQAVTRGERS